MSIDIAELVGTTGRSGRLWQGFDWARAKSDPSYGYVFHDDFMDLPTGKYVATQATAGTFTLDSAGGGLALADSGSTTNGQGINVQSRAVIAPSATTITYFESLFTMSGNATGPEWFLGLAELDTTFLASDAITSDDYIGFLSVASNAVTAVNKKTGITAGSQTGTALPTDGTFVRKGFRVNKLDSITFYEDGVPLSTVQLTSIPTENLALTIVCQTNATTQPITKLRWWAAGQLYLG